MNDRYGVDILCRYMVICVIPGMICTGIIPGCIIPVFTYVRLPYKYSYGAHDILSFRTHHTDAVFLYRISRYAHMNHSLLFRASTSSGPPACMSRSSRPTSPRLTKPEPSPSSAYARMRGGSTSGLQRYRTKSSSSKPHRSRRYTSSSSMFPE